MVLILCNWFVQVIIKGTLHCFYEFIQKGVPTIHIETINVCRYMYNEFDAHWYFIMTFWQYDTIEKILEREEKLNDLVEKSEGLSMQSKAFYKTVSMPTMLILFLKRPSTLSELVSENSPNFLCFLKNFYPSISTTWKWQKKIIIFRGKHEFCNFTITMW